MTATSLAQTMPPPPAFTVTTASSGDIFVGWTAPIGFQNQLQQLTATEPTVWSPVSGGTIYGLGQQVSTRVFVAPPPVGGPPPPTLPTPPFYDFFIQRLTGTSTALVSWQDAGVTYSAIVNQTFVVPGWNGFIWAAQVTTNPADIYHLTFLATDATYAAGATPPVTASLPPAQQTRLARLTSAYGFILANPNPNAGTQTTSQPAAGEHALYRVVLTALDSDGDGAFDHEEIAAHTNPFLGDSDGDGAFDHEEIAAGTNPFLGDSDGDGYLDADEIANGSNAALTTSKPFDSGRPRSSRQRHRH